MRDGQKRETSPFHVRERGTRRSPTTPLSPQPCGGRSRDELVRQIRQGRQSRSGEVIMVSASILALSQRNSAGEVSPTPTTAVIKTSIRPFWRVDDERRRLVRLIIYMSRVFVAPPERAGQISRKAFDPKWANIAEMAVPERSTADLAARYD